MLVKHHTNSKVYNWNVTNHLTYFVKTGIILGSISLPLKEILFTLFSLTEKKKISRINLQRASPIKL